MKIRKLKVDCILFIGGILCLFSISVFQSLNYSRCRKAYAIYSNQTKEIMAALISSEDISLSYVGRKIEFVNIDLVESKDKNDVGWGPRLWLFFDEMGCSACQESEATFASELAEHFGHHFVGVIVKSSNNRYIRNFVRMNRITFNVYSCRDNEMFITNRIINTPLLLLIDQENKVIACHYPVVGQQQYSVSFHEFTKRFFEAFSVTTLKLP